MLDSMAEVDRICGHCAHYSKEGQCLKNREHRGYWETRSCYEPSLKQPTKTCKICGKELPLDQFPKHPRTADGHSTICRECYKTKNAASIKKAAENSAASRKGIKRGPYRQGAIETKPAPKMETKPQPVIPSVRPAALHAFTDRELYDELVARGYTGTLTRVVTLSAEPNNQ